MLGWVKGEKWISDNALVSHLISEDNLRFVVIPITEYEFE
jgi:hypothetical protein